MTTPRKRPSSGFSAPEKDSEKVLNISPEVSVPPEEVLAEPVVEDQAKETPVVNKVVREIEPSEDLGPRFVVTSPPPEDLPPPVEISKGPQRHPRNIPKFSRSV
jgi:hypothetical protein